MLGLGEVDIFCWSSAEKIADIISVSGWKCLNDISVTNDWTYKQPQAAELQGNLFFKQGGGWYLGTMADSIGKIVDDESNMFHVCSDVTVFHHKARIFVRHHALYQASIDVLSLPT